MDTRLFMINTDMGALYFFNYATRTWQLPYQDDLFKDVFQVIQRNKLESYLILKNNNTFTFRKCKA